MWLWGGSVVAMGVLVVAMVGAVSVVAMGGQWWPWESQQWP